MEINEQNARISFTSYEEFNKTVIELDNMTNDELDFWINEKNHNSLYGFTKNNEKSSDYLQNLPDSYKAIFNSNSEIVISDKVIWLNEEELYKFNLSDDIESLKVNIHELTPIGSIKVEFQNIENTNKDQEFNRVSIGQNQLEARYQHEFNGYHYYDCSGSYRNINARLKYVHELMTVQTSYYNVGNSRLYLRVKLEWRGRRRWKSAGEPRDININLSGTYLTYPNGVQISTYGNNNVNLSYSCTGDKTILLKSSDSYDLAIYPYWSVQSSGTIHHQLHGSSAYAWNNSFIY